MVAKQSETVGTSTKWRPLHRGGWYRVRGSRSWQQKLALSSQLVGKPTAQGYVLSQLLALSREEGGDHHSRT